jgi:uncharacterized cupredoxin-like copper-binding protein
VQRVALAGVVLLTLVLAGCGDDDTSAATGPDVERDGVEVVAEDIAFGADGYEADAGTVTFTYRNDGSINHTLLVDDVDGFKLEVTANGDEDQGSVELEPGTYTLYCDVPGHREAGMEATLEVS